MIAPASIAKRVTIKVAPKKLKAFKQRVKELTGRSRGISMKRRMTDLNSYVRGWIPDFVVLYLRSGFTLPQMDMAADKWREDLLPIIERTK